ncbi:uroporphyrinogen-III synthase [Gracilibacillus massiliensis]|uniref:uroporphyrinogen-III synthase n=1 Tax=Gracilibacillus massiliensis TaxID=1564956 RepID=UPI00071C73DB|nr:uroporphyrinogen-III synthase [Gracilibacillus massiliensis]
MNQPLAGQHLMVTREATQALPLVHLLEAEGAKCIRVPLLRFEAIINKKNRHQFLRLNEKSDWLFFTSANAVRFFDQYVKELGVAVTQKIAAVGEKTTWMLEKHGYTIDFQPTIYSGDIMVKEFLHTYGKQKIALIVGSKSRPEIPQLLKEAEISFEKIVIYRTIKNKEMQPLLQQTVSKVDAVFFTSPSTVQAFQQFLTSQQFERIKEEVVAVAIGQTTATALEKAMFNDIISPDNYTIEDMVQCYINYIKKR